MITTVMERIVEISHKHKLGHIGSCLTTWPILEHIYSTKKPDDIIVLSSGHAGVALYVALEKYEGQNADELFERHGVHPCRDVDHGIHVSSGSLGSAVLVAVGMAIGNPKRKVHVILSDGECAEGSVWEALSFVKNSGLSNIEFHVNVNGFSAYAAVDRAYLWLRLKSFLFRVRVWFTATPKSAKFLEGLQAHYHILTPEHKDELVNILNAERLRENSSWNYGQGLARLSDYGRSGLRNIRRYTSGLSGAIRQYWFERTADDWDRDGPRL